MSRLTNFLDNAHILKFPGFRQTFEWNCGTTALNMVLAYYGYDVTESCIIKMSGANDKEGTPIEGMKKVAKSYGIQIKEGKLSTSEIRDNIDKGYPSILLIQAWTKKIDPDWKNEWDQGHYTVVIGYDKNRLIFADPISIKRVFLSDGSLNSRWHGFDDDGKKISKWGMICKGTPSYDFQNIEEMG